MKLAALYDIHGNLPALEAVLAELRHEAFDRIVVGGDVLPGPMPSECLDVLLGMEIPTEFLRGNGDRAVLEFLDGQGIDDVPEPFRELIRWSAEQLRPEQVEAIRAWPPNLQFEVPRIGEVLFCHATPRNDTEVFVRTTPESVLRPVFEGVTAAMVVCGHTHMPFDRMVSKMRVVNPGSIGSPYGEPGAYWLDLSDSVQLRRTGYDLSRAGIRMEATAYPQVGAFAESLRRPRSESEMLERFAAIALK